MPARYGMALETHPGEPQRPSGRRPWQPAASVCPAHATLRRPGPRKPQQRQVPATASLPCCRH